VDVLAVPGETVDGLLLTGVVAVAGVLGLLALRRAPRLALAVWLAVICLVPVWAGVSVGVDLEPEVLVSLVLLAAVLPAVTRARGRGPAVGRVTAGDLLVALFALVSLLPVVLGATTFSDVFVLAVQWSSAFLAGRLVGHRVRLEWVYGAVAVAFTGVAVLALVEYLTGWNPFLSIPGSGSLYEWWSTVQVRGGEPRAQGAFGHPIALAGCLAMAVPLTLAAPFRPAVRVPMAVLMLAAAAVTFSRVGLISGVLGVLLVVVLPRTGLPARVKGLVGGGLVLVGAALAPWVAGVFDSAGSEATDSAGYRVDLLGLVPDMSVLGLSPAAWLPPTGGRYFGDFRSIDSALLLLGLTYGWLSLVPALVLLAAACWLLVSGRATPPMIALVAQVPAFAVVALITQYATVVWFVAGLALHAQSLTRATGGAEPFPDRPPAADPRSPEMVGRRRP